MHTRSRALLAACSVAFLGAVLLRCSSVPSLPCTTCGDSCVDVRTDSENCGACGTACGLGSVCRDGACVDNAPIVDAGVCPTGQSLCGGRCATLSSDPANCGACGTACADAEKCSAGQCVASCGAGLTDCEGACAALETDPAHCGACGAVCTTQHGAATFCNAGHCDYQTCEAGFGDCDADRANGCEHRTDDDVSACGQCGVTCQPANTVAPQPCTQEDGGVLDGQLSAVGDAGVVALADGGFCLTPDAAANAGVAICQASACTYAACAPGFRDCDGNRANGCEAPATACAPFVSVSGTLLPTGELTPFLDQGIVRLNFIAPPTAFDFDGGSIPLAFEDAGTFAASDIVLPFDHSALQVDALSLPGSTGWIFYQTISNDGYFGVVMEFEDEASATAANDALSDAGLGGRTVTVKRFDLSN